MVVIGSADHDAAIAWKQSGNRWASTIVTPKDVNEPPREVPYIQFGSITEIDGTIVIGGTGSAQTIGAKAYPEPRVWLFEPRA